jgi:nitroimidazol reductase NimA-like FMN-containing flavoprotein (pyridoxamine 5'-phosphate oxidase superfamily)
VLLTMDRAERETFLEGPHVAIVSIPEPGRGPLAVPIWYGYERGGEPWIITDRASRKGRLLGVGTRLSLCVQSEQPPYRYVSVEGPVVSIEPADAERHARVLAHRYLGATLGDRDLEATAADRAAGGSIVVRMRPERWLSVDYGKQFQI